jgi:hypothetical protein
MRHTSRTIVLTFICLVLFGLLLGSPFSENANANSLTSSLYRARISTTTLSLPDALGHILYSGTPAIAAAGSSCMQTSTYNAGYRPRSLAVGDIDRDGKLDLVVANWYGNAVGILRGDGNGGF